MQRDEQDSVFAPHSSEVAVGNFGLFVPFVQVTQVVKNPPANVGDMGLIPGSGRSPGGGNGNPLQYSCLGNPGTEEPGWLQSKGLQRVRHDSVTEYASAGSYF